MYKQTPSNLYTPYTLSSGSTTISNTRHRANTTREKEHSRNRTSLEVKNGCHYTYSATYQRSPTHLIHIDSTVPSTGTRHRYHTRHRYPASTLSTGTGIIPSMWVRHRRPASVPSIGTQNIYYTVLSMCTQHRCLALLLPNS